MKKSYLIRSFDVTLSERFPKKAGLLYAAFAERLNALRRLYAGDIFKTGAAAFRRGGRLCRERDKDLARRLADRHDKMPVSRLLRKIRLSGALPLRRSEQRRVVISLGSSFRHRMNPFH